MIFNRSIIMTLSLIFLLVPLKAAGDISGSYKCSGNDPSDNEDYNSVLIVKNTGQTYDLKWEIIGNDQDFFGTGFLINSTQMVAEFWSGRRVGNSGVIVYTVTSTGLDGTYTYAERDYLGKEVCTKL